MPMMAMTTSNSIRVNPFRGSEPLLLPYVINAFIARNISVPSRQKFRGFLDTKNVVGDVKLAAG
jgi:hypothetical protein